MIFIYLVDPHIFSLYSASDGNMSNVTEEIELRKDIPVYLPDTHLLLVAVISVLGITGNILTLIKIIFDKTFHRTVFFIIGTIVFTDIINLSLYLVHSRFEKEEFRLENVPCVTFLVVFYGAAHASAAHVVFLFGLRCYMISEPIKFGQISKRTIFVASAVLWIVSVLFSLMYFLLRYKSGIRSTKYVVISFRLYLILIPTLLILVFHVKKVNRLKHTLNKHNVESNIIRMSLLTGLILFSYMASAVLFLLCYILSLRNCPYLEQRFLVAAQLAWLINAVSSPCIYFIAALQIPKSVKSLKTAIQDTICLKSGQRKNNDTEIWNDNDVKKTSNLNWVLIQARCCAGPAACQEWNDPNVHLCYQFLIEWLIGYLLFYVPLEIFR